MTEQSIDTTTRISALSTQHGQGLLGVPGQVRLTWQVETSGADGQLAYQISKGADPSELDPMPVQSGDAAVGVDAGTVPSGERIWFSVRIMTSRGWTEWAAPIVVEAGLTGEELVADVIGIATPVEGPAQILRTTFDVDARPGRARLRLSALGLVDAWINGKRATNAHLTPGWTSYHGRILLDTLDVTDLLRVGKNTIVLMVGDGWYRGRMGFADRTEIYGTESGALAQIDSEHGVLVSTSPEWKGGFGHVRGASIYDGTVIDLNAGHVDLHEVDFDDSSWAGAEVIEKDKSLFHPRSAPPIRVIEERPMVQVDSGPSPVWDAGQNISGWVRLVVRGSAGDRVTIRHAEVLEPSGELHTAALRTAKATDTYVLDRDGEHTLEPVFTFHGFQYAQAEGAEVISATAIAISSDLPEVSTFESSQDALVKLRTNVLWSQRDNFLSVPTDCPQRDERLGWTGDALAFAPTANLLQDSEAFWLSWLKDLEIDQTDEGGVPSVVPDIIRFGDMLMGGEAVNPMGRAAWADAATFVPMAVYTSYGSDEVLHQQLPSMRRWVEHLRRRTGSEILLPEEPFQYGDWLDPDAPGDRPWQAKVSSHFVANAFYVRSTRLLAQSEHIVGSAERGVEYEGLADTVATEVWNTWSDEALRTQTGAALALEFELVPQAQRQRVADALAQNVRDHDGRIETGFVGTPLVLDALAKNGHLEAAYLMLLRREAPSWLYQVEQGATTVWERWDAILPDGSIHSGDMDAGSSDGGGGSMLSFNHYAYGSVIDWVYRNVVGISPSSPGYKRTRLAPRPVEGVDSAGATVRTRYGDLALEWAVEGQTLKINARVPFGVTAQLDLPTSSTSSVTIDGREGLRDLPHGVYELVVTDPNIAAAR